MRTFMIIASLALALAPASAHAANEVFIVGPATAKPDLPGSVALATSPDGEIISVRWLVCRKACVERPGVIDPFGLADETGLVFGYRVKKANAGALLRVEATFADGSTGVSPGLRIKKPKRIPALPTARARALIDRNMKRSRLRQEWRSKLLSITACNRRNLHQLRCRLGGFAGDTEFSGFAEIKRVGNLYTGRFSDSVYAEVEVTNAYCVDTGGTDCIETHRITSG